MPPGPMVSIGKRGSQVSSATIKIIAAAVVTLCEVRQFTTDARGTRLARQLAQSLGHNPIVIAINQPNQPFAQ